MLDNLQATATIKMTPSTTTTTIAALMPMEILANGKNEEKDKDEKPLKSQKTKTILNWLKNTTTTTPSGTLKKSQQPPPAATTTTTTTPTATATAKSQHNNREINSCQRFDRRNHLDVNVLQDAQQQLTTEGKCSCATLSPPPTAASLSLTATVGSSVCDVRVDDACTCGLLKQTTDTHHSYHNSNNNNKNLIIPSSSSSLTTNTCRRNHHPPAHAAAAADETLREFRGVQTLRNFWNKRITANKESALRAKSFKQQQQQQQQFSKSQSCLISTSQQTGEPPPGADEEDKAKGTSFASLKIRAQSLHDCSQDFEELSGLSDIEIQKHLEKDNFYKYKTAEQALKLRELSENSATRRFSAGIILPWVQSFQKGERWFNKRKSTPLCLTANKLQQQQQQQQDIMDYNNDNGDNMTSLSDIVINDNAPRPSSLPRALCQLHAADDSSESESSPTLSIAKLNHRNAKVSPKRRRTSREDSLKTQESTGSVSRNSSTTSLALSANGLGTTSRSSSSKNRKYSFKTHSRSYHAVRRMHSQKDSTNINATTAHLHHHSASSSSLVAKLTQQFNEIIQHDKAILEEVKRKNGVLMTHRGHVYKVIETGKPTTTAAATASLSRTSSETAEKEVKTPGDSSAPSTVQKAIKKFEIVSRNNNKPKVPSKSLKVLKKSNEMVINKAGKVIYPPRAVMAKDGGASKCPPQSLMLSKTLEMVKEEAKTPIETKDDKTNATFQESLNEIKENFSLPKSSSQTTEEEKNEVTQDLRETRDSNCLSNIDKENQRNLQESLEESNPFQYPAVTERIYYNHKAFEENFLKDSKNSECNSFDEVGEKERSLSQEQRDSFFEEILKDPKRNEDDIVGYKTIAKRPKIIRGTSVIVDDPKKNLLIYINENVERRNSRNSLTGGGSLKSSNSSQDSSVNSQSLKENVYSRPAPKPELAKELAREFNKKFVSKGKKSKSFNGIEEMHQMKDLVVEECKEVIEGFSVTDGQSEMSDLTKDFINKEKIWDSDKEEIYHEIKCPSSDTKKCKTRHSKFYEKIKFFTLSRKSQKSNQLESSQSEEVSTVEVTECTTNSKTLRVSQSYTPMSASPTTPKPRDSCEVNYSPMYDPECKLLDAIIKVDEKIQNLGKPEQEKSPSAADKLIETDIYGHHVKPNSSFLHQSYTKDLPNKPAMIIQAVNVTLVNAIEGEQMIMEQKEIKLDNEIERQYINDTCEIPETLNSSPGGEEEPLYEPIGFVRQEESKLQPKKTETIYQSSGITKEITIEEDIYQSVEEIVNKNYESPVVVNLEKPPTPPPTPPQRLLADYEFIDESAPKTLTLNCHLQTPKASEEFDVYEECSPIIVDLTPHANSSSLVCIRKTTDELPDLPKPKRIMPKSPMPKRPPVKPMTPKTTSSTEISPPLTRPEDSHYYAEEEDGEEEEENIYDTIKGSHCYESLQSTGNKLQKSSSICTKNSDCLSINSNCYESISHFKPFRGVTRSHHSSSSHGSNLTISSDNKTNSLYEDSLGSALHSYSSKRIYRSNTESQIDMQKQNKQEGRKNSCNALMGGGRTSDTSDEWTDVSDNDHGDEEGEDQAPQFIIVRSKAHKSPDWSRRVRDKRLHHQRKSKSCIEDDDPDHYYEQLSPSALNKRHSLGIQERSGSLQRNQEAAVRVSKRGKQISYSAHALGQEISDDSFDSDTDDYYESENVKNSHNDSGVDIRTSKLPDPPSSSNQMYAFVKKFKNFIGGNRKSPNGSKLDNSQQKINEDANSQFYVNGNIYSPPGGRIGGGIGSVINKSPLQVPQTKELSTSEKNLIMAQSSVTKAEQMTTTTITTTTTTTTTTTSTTPRKLKSGKSLRSRLRKSLVGFDNKQLQTLTPTRSTFYVEDPCNADDANGQLDSGFSEKASSGDIPNNSSTNTSAASSSSVAAADTQKFTTLATLAARKAKKETKVFNAHRRRTTIGIRPIEPPPPPPDAGSGVRRQSNTSWYAECGVFKNGTTNLVTDDSQLLHGQNGTSNGGTSGASWYEEAGLYQTSGVSVASSSGSSGVSTSNEACPTDEMSHSMFSNEPLYQIYSAAKLEAISRDMHDEGGSTDGYEEVGERRRSIIGDGGGGGEEKQRKTGRQTALELVEKERGPARTLWSHIPEVVNSMILPTMTPRERALMEAKFEIITSEASYLKSLNLLRSHFMNHPVFRDQNLVNSRDRKNLFAHIVPVHDCSERLLTELETCWQDNIMLIGLSKRIYAIAEKHFHVYVTFCEHQGRMDRTLKRLRANKGLFSQNLELLESSDTCCGLKLHSFLMLPMQRITRLPLLIDAVFSKCDPNDDEYDNWKMCLAMINKIVTQCNEAATKSDQAFEIEKISRQLEFNPSIIRPLAIAPAGVLAPGTKPRFLVKKGEFTHLIWRGDDAKLTFGKKFTKTSVYAFLFSDLLVLTKRKGEEQFSVFDYCPRNMLTITSGDTLPQLPTKDLNSQTSKNLILMTLLENHERKTNELLLSCPSVSEQERWLQAMRPPESETPGEKLYEQWDCPQVMAKHGYENNEPDGLSLEVGDVVNVTRKLPDGWYQGERIRDGAIGWFPSSYTEEVNSAHVRARNLKLRHRLLTFTATYLESQKRSK